MSSSFVSAYLIIRLHLGEAPSFFNEVDPRIKGKVDIIDTKKGRVIFSLVGGAQPTALEVSRDGAILISSGFIDERLYFFDLKRILSVYETPAISYHFSR